jgi:hypothetical protein
MRPINRGLWPTWRRGNTNVPYVFNDWTNARDHLVERTGLYCHFCEMRVNNCIAVEHIKSRDGYPKLSNNWSNFLLICASCNSNKKAKKLEVPYRQHYYWPHLNNTLLAFSSPIYEPNSLLALMPKAGLSPHQKSRADATIALYGLDKIDTSTGDSDKRHIERKTATKKAIDRLIEYQSGKATISAIVDMATTTGFFSVWLGVFNDITPVKHALLQAPEFKIDVATWFDTAFNPSPRNPTKVDPI